MRLRKLILLLLLLQPHAADAQQVDTADYIEAGWKRIVNTRADYRLVATEELDSDRAFFYWKQIRDACVEEFDATLEVARSRNDIDRFAEAFVRRFGTEGPQADIRWAFACCGVLFLNRSGTVPEYDDLVVPFSTHLVDECLTSPSFLQRLYWFRRWAGDARNKKSSDGFEVDAVGTDISLCRDTISAPPGSGTYQFAVTRFLMLAYLCDWEGNFSDFKRPGGTAYFRRKFAQFEFDYSRDVTSLRFDAKEYRFKKPRVTLVPGFFSEKQLPTFDAPPIPFPDAKKFPPLPKPDEPGWDDVRHLFQY